jgi:hypothetical protein
LARQGSFLTTPSLAPILLPNAAWRGFTAAITARDFLIVEGGTNPDATHVLADTPGGEQQIAKTGLKALAQF